MREKGIWTGEIEEGSRGGERERDIDINYASYNVIARYTIYNS